MAACITYLEYLFYIGLLFFVIPINIKTPSREEIEFENYLKKFNKSYSGDEYAKRFESFKNSLNSINTYNSNRTNHSAEYGWTKFSDMFPEEFLSNRLLTHLHQRNEKRTTANKVNRRKRNLSKLPSVVDWRKKHAVTELKDQGNCGACWAFSAVEMIESMHAIATGTLEQFSVQQMIDCASESNKGCLGGDICSLLHWMTSTDTALYKESEYPYHFTNSSCRMNQTLSGIKIKDFGCDDLVDNEDMILELIAENGPVAVAINAKTWQNYIGGVIQFHCDGDSKQLNHAVELVGYNLTAPVPYYIARNSWGKDFGDDGYLYLVIGQNICGLANEVTAITLL